MKKIAPQEFAIQMRDAARWLPSVADEDHKGRRGRSLILAGSPEFPGAGILAASGASRSGSGYVLLAQPRINFYCDQADFIYVDLTKKNIADLKFDSILVGPGFGVNEFTADMLKFLKAINFESVVIDADAITTCSKYKLFPLPPTWIITPHSGELARCLETSSEQVNRDRVCAVRRAQSQMNCIVLLKGHRTLICDKRKIFLNYTGNSALAKAGSGDVLAGVITAFLAQGVKPFEAAVLGAYVHGATANIWASEKKDLLAMRPTDIVDLLPKVLFKIRQLKK